VAVLTAVALGSNIPPRGAALLEAASLIGRLPETTVTARSGIYETEPVGGPRQGLFLNAALLVETGLGPSPLLEHFHKIENKMGRERRGRNFPRAIDLDIIFYGDRTVRLPGLEIPHPRFRQRGFVLQPLADIIPRFEDPITGRSVKDLFEDWVRSGGRPAAGRDFATGEPWN